MKQIEHLIKNIVDLYSSDSEQMTVETARKVIKEINDFFYTNYEGIGYVEFFGEKFQYFSEFHKFWETHHKEILNISIDDVACKEVAIKLHQVFLRTNGSAFKEIYDTKGLDNEAISRVRFLTANQDFGTSLKFDKLAKIYSSDNSIFDERKVFENPEEFLSMINVGKLSQNDKRIQFAKNVSQFLIERETSPFGLLAYYDNDVKKLREDILSYENNGYGNKKTDMFIRDMVVLGVWDGVKEFDKIDVASDLNTIKVALRTGILKTEIPLVSSFIDIFCYQYEYVDKMNAMAWRRVWELWNKMFPEEAIASPSMLDYFIYGVIGKQFCNEVLFIFKCLEEEHSFKWHSARNKTCQICYGEGKFRNKAKVESRMLPCLDNEGFIAIQKTAFFISKIADPNYEECPFKDICNSSNKQYLKPPKSISIKGRTGWTTAYTRKDEGGGGLMS